MTRTAEDTGVWSRRGRVDELPPDVRNRSDEKPPHDIVDGVRRQRERAACRPSGDWLQGSVTE